MDLSELDLLKLLTANFAGGDFTLSLIETVQSKIDDATLLQIDFFLVKNSNHDRMASD